VGNDARGDWRVLAEVGGNWRKFKVQNSKWGADLASWGDATRVARPVFLRGLVTGKLFR
jgi:hypothetical protein